MSTHLRSLIVSLVGLWLMALGSGLHAAEPKAASAESKKVPEPFVADTFTSGGRSIRVWRAEPKTSGKHPAVLLLHGIDGPQQDQAIYCMVARCLTAQGYTVFLVHYFDRTHPDGKDLQAAKDQLRRCLGSGATDKERQAAGVDFLAWLLCLNDGLTYARGRATRPVRTSDAGPPAAGVARPGRIG